MFVGGVGDGEEEEEGGSEEEVLEVGGGNTNAPCLEPPFPGKGLPTVGVGPQSTGGNIKVGRKVRRMGRCGAKRVGCELHRGVRVERKVERW
jgi:hypothetical protein